MRNLSLFSEIGRSSPWPHWTKGKSLVPIANNQQQTIELNNLPALTATFPSLNAITFR